MEKLERLKLQAYSRGIVLHQWLKLPNGKVTYFSPSDDEMFLDENDNLYWHFKSYPIRTAEGEWAKLCDSNGNLTPVKDNYTMY